MCRLLPRSLFTSHDRHCRHCCWQCLQKRQLQLCISCRQPHNQSDHKQQRSHQKIVPQTKAPSTPITPPTPIVTPPNSHSILTARHVHSMGSGLSFPLVSRAAVRAAPSKVSVGRTRRIRQPRVQFTNEAFVRQAGERRRDLE
jgi:hypothetical protein